MHIPTPSSKDLPELLTESGVKIPLQDLLEIEPDKVGLYLSNQAGWQAVIAYSHGKAKLATERLKKRVEEVEAETFISIWRAHKGVKGVTMDVIKNLVVIDPNYEAARLRYLKAKETELAFETARNAMQVRCEMIIQLGADVRLEKKASALG